MPPACKSSEDSGRNAGLDRRRELFRRRRQPHRSSGRTQMNGQTGIIERAFQLALVAATVEEIRTRLRKEGYFNVDAPNRRLEIGHTWIAASWQPKPVSISQAASGWRST